MTKMLPLPTPRRRVLPAALGALALAAGAAGASSSMNGTASEPVVCQIAITEARGGVTFEARVLAERPSAGSYRLSISRTGGGNRAMIQQSGDFRAGPDSPAMLGMATLGGTAQTYRADLEVRVDGRRLTCSETDGTPDL